MSATKKTQKSKNKKPEYREKSNTGGPYHAKFARGINGTDSILATPFPQVAFVGRSNVGKSSTINTLLGVSGLARTSTTPGKTQEINFFTVNDNMYIVDLPGYGYARMPAKDAERLRMHILWYLSGGEVRPKLVVLIVDSRHELTDYDADLLEVVKGEGHPLLVLLNKIDKLTQSERSKTMRYYQETLGDIPFIPFSAMNKEGLEDLRARVFAKK